MPSEGFQRNAGLTIRRQLGLDVAHFGLGRVLAQSAEEFADGRLGDGFGASLVEQGLSLALAENCKWPWTDESLCDFGCRSDLVLN
jgi:hypothetical protein